MTLSVPEHVSDILNTLNDAGYEAYAVGGCVRDALLGREPEDWDITTSARPEQVKALFRRTVDTGIQHGTVTVLIQNSSYEITTYRIDGIYEDGRHPREVSFTSRLAEDLKRRDFTINAMAYHPEEGLVDLYGGVNDLKNKRLRAVGIPEERFQEDSLRILRAVRFAAQLGLCIEEHTRRAIPTFAGRLKLISQERIQTELNKLLKSPHPETFRLLYETGITNIIFPEFDCMMVLAQNNPYHCYTVGEHTLKMLSVIDPDPLLRWSALLHDVGKIRTRFTDEKGIDHFCNHGRESAVMARDFLRDLRFDNATVDAIYLLIRYHDYCFDKTKGNLRKAIHKVGEELFPYLLKIVRADTLAKSEFAIGLLMPEIDCLEELYAEILRDRDCTSLKDLAVNGKDLIAAGMKPGKELGKTLENLLQTVLEHPEKNTRETLLALVLQQMKTKEVN